MQDKQAKQGPNEVTKIECDRQLNVVRFSPCGRYLVGGGYDASLRRWDLSGVEPKELAAISGHRGWVQWLAFHPQQKLLFSVDSWGGLRATRYTEEKPTTAWAQESAHDGWIRAMSLAADGQQVATAGRDRTARVWSTTDGKQLHQFGEHPEEVYAVAIHPDGRSLVTGDLFGTLRCRQLDTGKSIAEKKVDKLHLYERIQDVGGLRWLKFHDEKTLVCAGAEPQRAGRSIAIPTIHWLKWPSLEVQHTARFGPEKHGFVFDLAWHPGGYWAAVTSGQPGNGQFLLLRPGEAEPFFITTKMSNCHSLAVDPGGRIAVAASNRNSQGNGAVKDKAGNYLGNWSPIHLFEVPEPTG